jgi:dihydrodipicolinate synthase/N-acetylneuraminate lyase
MPEAITGLWAAATTPTDAAGAIDHAALARHAQRLLNSGCDGLVLFGCGSANLVPMLLRRVFRDAGAQHLIDPACAPIGGIPLLKAVLAAMTGKAIWRNVRPPMRAADAAEGTRIAAMLERLERQA